MNRTQGSPWPERITAFVDILGFRKLITEMAKDLEVFETVKGALQYVLAEERGQIRSWLFTVDSGKGRFRRRESLFGSAANNRERKTRLQREIETTDREIDQLVYELYG